MKTIYLEYFKYVCLNTKHSSFYVVQTILRYKLSLNFLNFCVQTQTNVNVSSDKYYVCACVCMF